MAHQWADRVAETSTTTGTGALTLAGAVTGFQRFSAICSVNDTVIYAIEAVDGSGVPTGDWEVGVGTYSALNTLTRTTVIKSSNSNAAVTFAAGTKNVFLDDIAETRNTLQEYSGAQSSNQPSAPPSGAILWSQDRNGVPVVMQRGVNGISVPVNPLISGRQGGIVKGLPNAAGSMSIFGTTFSTTGQVATTMASTSAYTQTQRFSVQTTATSGTAGSARMTDSLIFARGSNANSGFCLTMVTGPETIGNTNYRAFVGLLDIATAPAATVDPASGLTNCVGIGKSGTDTNWKFYYNDAAGNASVVDLGANYANTTVKTKMVELTLWAAAGDSSFKYMVRRLDDLTIAPTTGSVSTDIPSAGTVLFPHWHVNNNATAANSAVTVGGLSLEWGI